MRPQPWLVVAIVAALCGLLFAGISTYDFVQHLDRQVHSLHCSFIPGAGAQTGESGCQVAMMSSYSSVLRTEVWGGIPISLPAMAVFAFLGVFGFDLWFGRRLTDRRATGFFALAAALPVVTSIGMLAISLTKLGTTCKLCVAIYAASGICFVAAMVLWRRAVGTPASRASISRASSRTKRPDEPAWAAATVPAMDADVDEQSVLASEVRHPEASWTFLGGAFGVGVAFVVIPLIAYIALAPDHGRYIGACDALVKPDDTYGVMVRVDQGARAGVPAIEVLDPLCPACRAFEKRLEDSGMKSELDRKAVLFPLDNTCNWMVTEATHPGACTVSEAVLCAGDKAPEVLRWAFETQESIRAAAAKDPTAAEKIVEQRFPDLAACVGSPEAKSRLNKSLRWAVANNVRVLTPQLYIANVKLCDEDVDLGLEYALRRLIDGHRNGTLTASPLAPATPPPVEPAPGAPATTAPSASTPAAQPGSPAAPSAPQSGSPSNPTGAAPSTATGSPPSPTTPPVNDPAPAPAGDQPVTSPSGAPGPTETLKPSVEPTPPAAAPTGASPPAAPSPEPTPPAAPAPANPDQGGAS